MVSCDKRFQDQAHCLVMSSNVYRLEGWQLKAAKNVASACTTGHDQNEGICLIVV